MSIAQLLTLSHLSEEETLSDIKPVDLHSATEITTSGAAREKDIEIELAPKFFKPIILVMICYRYLIRNVVDNAIRYASQARSKSISLTRSRHSACK